MTFFLTTLPLWLSAVILIVPTTLLAMAGPVIVRRYVDVNQLRTNNEVAGFKYATVGVLYAVLLAFAVVVVWEKFNQAESEVAKEAGAAATVFRLTQGVDPERGAAIREATTGYLMSASLIGHSGSSAFRLSTTTVSMSLTGSCFSSESAPGALPSWDSKTRWNNLLGGLAVRRTVGPSGHANSPHPSSREGHHSTARWSSSVLLFD